LALGTAACGTDGNASSIDNPPNANASGAGGSDDTYYPEVPSCPDLSSFGSESVVWIENSPLACDELVVVAERGGMRQVVECAHATPRCPCLLPYDPGTYVVSVLLGCAFPIVPATRASRTQALATEVLRTEVPQTAAMLPCCGRSPDRWRRRR
jgi:hypothetical protein